MSSELKYKYRIFCETDNQWEYEYCTSANVPTVCPVDGGHTVNANSVGIGAGPTIVSLSIPHKIKKKSLKDSTYTELTTYEFPGTTFCGDFKYAKLIMRMDDNGSGKEGDEGFGVYLQIYDLTNNTAILTSNESPCTESVSPLSFDIVNTCSVDPALWQVSIKRTASKSGDVHFKAVDFYFY